MVDDAVVVHDDPSEGRAFGPLRSPWWVAALALGLFIALAASLQPVTRLTTATNTNVTSFSQCGVRYYVFGAPSPEVTATCRQAYGAHAQVGFVLVLALVALLAFAVRTSTRRRQLGRPALVVAGAVAVLLVLQPVGRLTTAHGHTRFNRCGITYFVFGGPHPEVTDACRHAFGGRVYEALALASLCGAASFAAAVARRRVRQSEDETPRARLTRPRVGIGASARDVLTRPPIALYAALGLVLVVVLAIALRPETVVTTASDGVVRQSHCGIEYFAFGAGHSEVTHACRAAFTGHAIGGFLALVGVALLAALAIWFFQYLRGYALGEVWDDAERRPVATWGPVPVVGVVAMLALAAAANGGFRTPQLAARATTRPSIATNRPGQPLDSVPGSSLDASLGASLLGIEPLSLPASTPGPEPSDSGGNDADEGGGVASPPPPPPLKCSADQMLPAPVFAPAVTQLRMVDAEALMLGVPAPDISPTVASQGGCTGGS